MIAALVEKRNEAEREIVALKKQVTARRSDLDQIDQAIKVLAPDLQTARLIATAMAGPGSSSPVDSPGAARTPREVEGVWITAEDIARTAMRDKGLDPADSEIRGDFRLHPPPTLGPEPLLPAGCGGERRLGHGGTMEAASQVAAQAHFRHGSLEWAMRVIHFHHPNCRTGMGGAGRLPATTRFQYDHERGSMMPGGAASRASMNS
ncbi:MAG TPA: hypothetical protein VFN77_03325 [Acetobacteraceae bacterium]|nr:hypothetical protein [Acetobacteraceae bacterium]